MHRVRVKVCGITRREDALAAVELGASALGFLFWPESPRAVAIDRARAIVDALPPFVTSVGVFVNQPPGDVRDTVGRVGLSAIQLHGDEEAAAYSWCGARVIKALPVGPAFTMSAVEDVPHGMGVLLDAHDPVRRGGTGKPVEWTVAAAAARVRPIILSGGLTPGNVQAAIEQVRPAALDVSSGVETAPGVKDLSKLRAFFAAVGSVHS